MTSKYVRSQIYAFCELPKFKQIEIASDMDYLEPDELEAETFVKNPCHDGDFLPLSMFMRHKGNFTHGIYGQTAFSAYYITINRMGEEATVAYKYF